ncbi:MAG: pyridoxal phosphate-dependent aminotransferase family protein, partial [Candidatus Aminicenantes bacterium]|nr:pyridoxal phosphate-dependent aminotransferase family protein [Candidatus Aminicenantes bacterium]
MMETAPGAEVIINGRRLIYFGGTGYFGLQGHPEVIKAGIEAFRQYGVHVATSRISFGNNPVLLTLEKKIADFFGTEAAIYLASGYFINLTLVQGLSHLYEKIYMDELAHFSIRDAVYSARKPVLTFRHRDPEDLKKKIRAELKANERPLVITDGLFPIFGSLAPVEAYLPLIEEYNGLLCLDDAHAVGILGPKGRGTFDYFGLKGDRLFFGATLSKAFGGYGGFIPGTRDFLEKVRLTVGVYKGATPAPTPIAAATLKAIDLVAQHPEWRETVSYTHLTLPTS